MHEGETENLRPGAAKRKSNKPHYVAAESDGRSFKRLVAKWNRKAFDDLKIPYQDRGDVLLMRFSNRPPVEFYPQTGRWRDRWGRLYAGGARAFLRWYVERKPPKPDPAAGRRMARLQELARRGKAVE